MFLSGGAYLDVDVHPTEVRPLQVVQRLFRIAFVHKLGKREALLQVDVDFAELAERSLKAVLLNVEGNVLHVECHDDDDSAVCEFS